MAPKTTDLFGTIHITDGTGQKFEGYYSTLEALRPLLDSEEWQAQTTGFYLNAGGTNCDAVRISYFCANGQDPRPVVQAFARNHDLCLVAAARPPAQVAIASAYGGDEARFRRFLSTYSQIGLDLIRSDLNHARCLFATFRFQVFPSRGDYRAHFAPSFEARSPFYQTMSQREKDQFWADLANWPNPPQVDWAHMFVNMVLGCDWNNHLMNLQRLSVEEINQVLRQQHIFEVPPGWAPGGA